MTLKKIIELKDVDVYNGDALILQDVNFDLVDAEFCYLVGKSGSGKTSLLKTIYAYLPLKKGSVQVCNQDIAQLNRKSMPAFRRKLGIIFQEFNLFDAWTVHENLKYILEATDWDDNLLIDQRIEKVLADVNLTSKTQEKVYKLSGGEQQKLVIARAILNDPELIIADEPTGNLDDESSNEIIQLIKNVTAKNKTATIFATHNEQLRSLFPARTVQCFDGKLVEL